MAHIASSHLLLKALEKSFPKAVKLTVTDVSHTHASHNPLAKHGGTHFNVVITSPEFHETSYIARQKSLIAIISKLFGPPLVEHNISGSIHSVSAQLYTPEEVAKKT